MTKPNRDNKSLEIMVVDDNEDASEVLRLLFEALGHSACVEYNALSAINRAKREGAEMLFIDIGLPGMDGYELARRLRAMPQTANSILVAVTSFSEAKDKQLAKDAGFNNHLAKPINLNDILGIIDQYQLSRAENT